MKTKYNRASSSTNQSQHFLLKVKEIFLLKWKTWFQHSAMSFDDAFPLRAELYSAIQMEQHGRGLARSHHLAPHSGRNQLLQRLADNEERIIDACAHLVAATALGRQVSPAAEWLLDNFYVIEEQIHTAKRHLPKDYSRQLPRLSNGQSRGLPRVYELALEAIAHGDGRIDPESLHGFIAAYQETQTLMLGELWAIPIMLRLALIENLRRVALRVKQSRIERNLACEWAQRLADCIDEEANNLILVVAELANSQPPMKSAFVAEFVRQIQGKSPSLLLPLSWLSQRLADSNQQIETMLQIDAQLQAADQVSVSNSIASLRLLSTIDWRIFVENLSHVDQCMRQDPCLTYSQMDFSTRDHYRHAVEQFARSSRYSELEVAQIALRLATQAIKNESDSSRLQSGRTTDTRQQHIGYFLIGRGVPELENLLDPHYSIITRWHQSLLKLPLFFYLFGIALLSVGGYLVLGDFFQIKHENLWVIALTAFLSILVLSQFGVNTINWLITIVSSPKPLPRMDFEFGVPIGSACMIAVPCLLTSQKNIDQLVDALELRFLGNRDPHLRYCLLSDFADANSAEMPQDQGLLLYAEKSISLLNQKYRHTQASLPVNEDAKSAYHQEAIDYFLLFHRPRLWNAQEQCWMGYERKRGKLAALNAYLRGHGRDAFSLIVGATDLLPVMTYVITLDADTELPRDAARKFIATMAHPLNRARYDTQLKRVVEGYGILQPRVSVSLPNEQATRYELLCAGELGIDPYTRSVSDVYQDLFGEGSFIGKGIYEIDSFELALKDRLPENRILSHDLLEGCYARAGLISDVSLHEQQPASYHADVMRRHRWVRGDWQIAAWLVNQVPTYSSLATSARLSCHNPLTPLSRWKLFDNLRRSLLAITLVLLFVFSWFVLKAPTYGLILAFISLCAPCVLSLSRSAVNLIKPNQQLAWKGLTKEFVWQCKQQFMQMFLALSFLPYEAFYHIDAICRTQWRIRVSKKQLLEWSPSSETNRHLGNSSRLTFRSMWISPFSAIAILAALVGWRSESILAALPVLFLWFCAPFSAAWISRAAPHTIYQINANERQYLRALARKTWLFFERHVNAEHHWLPPDNVQEFPIEVTAHRTSPTNMGLSLLANLTAYDFAFISASRLLKRTQLSIATMRGLARFQGHFYNWYDTESLSPLLPKYVSTVDSGNLVGHLLVLKSGLLALQSSPIFRWDYFDALRDTFNLFCQHLDPTEACEFDACRLALEHACIDSAPQQQNLINAHRHLLAIDSHWSATVSTRTKQKSIAIQMWLDALSEQIRDGLEDLEYHCPWLVLMGSLDQQQVRSFSQLSRIPSHQHLVQMHEDFFANMQAHQHRIDIEKTTASTESEADLSLDQVLQATQLASAQASAQLLLIKTLCAQMDDLCQMELGFLYNATSHLMAIGYNQTDNRLDSSCYDLLASEARLATFVGIAQNKLPQDSWFALGRQLTLANGDPILMSWSGSMFEYLMPLLVMPNFTHTLLDQTYQSSVKRQISYGAERGVPWGISESGYNLLDSNLNYQYRAFGVPGIGFKRGLGDELVIAPYASMMALMVLPEEACKNLQAMSDLGFEGVCGFYEAIDYTAARLSRAQTQVVVRSFMSHHQGMGLLAIAYLLLDKPMQKRFMAEPILQAALPLLHERVPKTHSSYVNTSELADIRNNLNQQELAVRVLHRADHQTSDVQLLSNGRYHLMITAAGGSASRWNDMAITRWQEDSTRDHWGSFCYLREFDSHGKPVQEFWSSTYQPSLVQADQMEIIFSEGRAEFRRLDHQFIQHTEVVLSPEDDIELRRTHITNRSRLPRVLELTSYAEVVLNQAVADRAHPAFSNLFVQTEIIEDQQAIICQRRPRSESEHYPCMFHLAAVHGVAIESISYETDRSQFIGRTRDLRNPQAMQTLGELSNTDGSVLDPIVAIRVRVHLAPEQTMSIDFVTGVANDRQVALLLIAKYRDRHLADRVIELSWTHSQVVLRQLNISESEAQTYAKLASSIIFVNPLLRPDPAILQLIHRQQSALWSYAISGDLPIVLVQIKDQANIALVQQLIAAHIYWKSKGLEVDLVIWNEEHNGYRQALQEQIVGLISTLPLIHQNKSSVKAKQGGIFLRALDQISLEDRHLFLNVARIVLSDQQGSLIEQMNRRPTMERSVPALETSKSNTMYLAKLFGVGLRPKYSGSPAFINELISPKVVGLASVSTTRIEELREDNGYGGFSQDGQSYVIRTTSDRKTPAPWVNVIANSQIGTVISESGQSYTWVANAHEFRLTPWSNDAVSDAGAEAFYIRNEKTGKFWSPQPRGGDGAYRCEHGFGYSELTHNEEDISSTLCTFVCLDVPIKYTILRVENLGAENQELSVSAYIEWVLGDVREKTQMHIQTWLESNLESGAQAILARNPYHAEFAHYTAFFQGQCCDERRLPMHQSSYTADRREFIGRNRSLDHPLAMEKKGLSGRLGAGLDPCAAMQYLITLEPKEYCEFVFMLGAQDSRHQPQAKAVSSLLTEYEGSRRAKLELQRVKEYWAKNLSQIVVKTPEPSFDLLANGWLQYQTVSARMWGRSGFYQSGGAYGFRDQLQDSMALVHSLPDLVRQHILLAASHQFKEGDVQHWWHPPGDRGVRTRCSDDFMWLVAAVHRYVKVTGDKLILDEIIPYIQSRSLNPDEDSNYDLAEISNESATLYQHCIRAIDHSDRMGEHGLCLIGSGDWNDGFDLVGVKGKGESIWLSFFVYQCLLDFVPIALARGEGVTGANWQQRAQHLQLAINQYAWDGAWYRRAYFDDGTIMGSQQNQVCQIDSIAQSWSVLSGEGSPNQTAMAMQSVLDRLVDPSAGVVKLLAPPFDQIGTNPGYIRAYVPGVRENGGQYTHAAIWVVMALAKLGRKDEAWAVLRLINPIHHGNSSGNIGRYKVEPYVIAADVYAVEPHIGRGGWTWYTGSAAWMLRLMWESLLGVDVQADQLRLQPCVPKEWDEFSMTYRYQSSRYEISVKQINFGGSGLSLDGIPQSDGAITMCDDGKTHHVLLLIESEAAS